MRNITPIIPINLNKPLIRLATPRKTDKRYRDEYMPASFKKFKTKHTRHTPLYQKMSKKLIIRHASHPYQIKSFPKKNSACDAIRSISKKLHKRAYEFTHRIENGEYLGTIKNSLLNYISKFTKSNHALKILFVIAILEKCTKLNEKQKQSFLLFFKMQYPDYSPLSTGYLTDIQDIFTDKINILILDDFIKPKDDKKSHGEIVLKSAKKLSPFAQLKTENFFQFENDKKDFTLALKNSNIVNISFGPAYRTRQYKKIETSDYEIYFKQIDEATKSGKAIVFAAGNQTIPLGHSVIEQKRTMLYTKINTSKSYSGGVLFVGSSDIKGTKSLADYSNMAGLSKDFFILTKELKRKHSGTSFTAPQISAVLAKLKAAFPEYRMKDCINLILASAELPKTIHPDDLKRFQNSTNLTDKQINKLIPSDVYGRGWANARKAYELGKALYPAPITLPSLNHKNDQMIQESLSDPFFFYQLLEEPNLDKAWNLFKSLLPEWDLFENYLKNSPEEKRETYMNFLNKILNYALANDLVETEDGSKLYDKISDAIFFIDFKL